MSSPRKPGLPPTWRARRSAITRGLTEGMASFFSLPAVLSSRNGLNTHLEATGLWPSLQRTLAAQAFSKVGSTVMRRLLPLLLLVQGCASAPGLDWAEAPV